MLRHQGNGFFFIGSLELFVREQLKWKVLIWTRRREFGPRSRINPDPIPPTKSSNSGGFDRGSYIIDWFRSGTMDSKDWHRQFADELEVGLYRLKPGPVGHIFAFFRWRKKARMELKLVPK